MSLQAPFLVMGASFGQPGDPAVVFCRRRRPDGARNANTIGIDDLDVTQFEGDIFDRTPCMRCRDGQLRCRVLLRRRHPRLAASDPLFRTNVDGLRGVQVA